MDNQDTSTWDWIPEFETPEEIIQKMKDAGMVRTAKEQGSIDFHKFIGQKAKGNKRGKNRKNVSK